MFTSKTGEEIFGKTNGVIRRGRKVKKRIVNYRNKYKESIEAYVFRNVIGQSITLYANLTYRFLICW